MIVFYFFEFEVLVWDSIKVIMVINCREIVECVVGIEVIFFFGRCASGLVEEIFLGFFCFNFRVWVFLVF